MLPFLNPKKQAAIIIAKQSKSGSVDSQSESNEPTPEMVACAERILSAIAMKDAKALAAELDALMDYEESEPEPQEL